MKIVVGIRSQQTESAAGERNNSDLAAQKTRFRRRRGDEQAGHIRKPAGLEIIVVFGDGRLFDGATVDVNDEESPDVLGGRLHNGNHDALAIGRPGKREAIRLNVLVMKEVTFESAIAARELEVGNRGIAVLVQVGKTLAVRRKGNGAVNVLDEQTRGSAEHGRVVKGRDGLLGVVAAHKVNIIAVGRKSEAAVARCGGRNYLRVAPGGNVAKPEGLQAIFVENVEEVFSVWGNPCKEDVAVVGEIFDGHCFDGQSFFVGQKRVNAEGRGDDHEEGNPKHEAGAEFVFAGRGD